MLNKEICRKCWMKHKISVEGFKLDWSENDGSWKITPEENWEKKKLVCCMFRSPGLNSWDLISVEGLPPRKCPYVLEQVIDAE